MMLMLVLVIVLSVFAVGIYIYVRGNNQATQYVDNSQIIAQDTQFVTSQHSSVDKIDNAFLVGKSFDYFCTSGESGTFKSDGSITIKYGTSQGDAPVNPISARWELKSGQLMMYDTSNDKLVDSAKNFKLYNFSGDTFAVSEGVGCDSMIIGPNFIKNENFFRSAPSAYFEAGLNSK